MRDRNKKAVEERKEPQEHENRLEESLSRTRRNIVDTILCNNFDLFCTFTFSADKVEDRPDYKTLRKQLSQHLNNYQKRKSKNFKYLFIPERHQDGAIHFHGVCTNINDLICPEYIQKRMPNGDVKFVPNTKQYLDWRYYSDRFGFFSCSRIVHHGKCAKYVAKYMTKDLLTWVNKGGRIVFKSQGLDKPELVYDGDEQTLGALKPTDCDSEWCKASWADDEYTSRFYRHWSYPHKNDIIQPEDWWKHAQWRKFNISDTCVEQMTIKDLIIKHEVKKNEK